MKLYFTYEKSTGLVNSYSDGINDCADHFLILPLEIDEMTYQKMQENPIMFIEKGKLVLTDRPHIQKKKLTQEKIKKAKSVDDIKEILNEFLT